MIRCFPRNRPEMSFLGSLFCRAHGVSIWDSIMTCVLAFINVFLPSARTGELFMEPMDADRTSCIDLALGSQALTSSACFCEIFSLAGLI